MSKTTCNLHIGMGILILVFFLAAAGREAWLLLRCASKIRHSVAVKAILTVILIAAIYVVLALWNFFAII